MNSNLCKEYTEEFPLMFNKISNKKDEIKSFLKTKIKTCCKDGYIVDTKFVSITNLSKIVDHYIIYMITYKAYLFTIVPKDKIDMEIKKIEEKFTILSKFDDPVKGDAIRGIVMENMSKLGKKVGNKINCEVLDVRYADRIYCTLKYLD